MAIDAYLHRINGLALAACLALAGCGGEHAPAPPGAQTVLAGTLVNMAEPGDGGDPPPEPPPPPPPAPLPDIEGQPEGVRYVVPAPFIASGVNLDVVVGQHASALCLREANPLLPRKCMPVKAPLPANMELGYFDGGQEARMLTFTAVNDNDLTTSIALVSPWVQALATASTDWGNYLDQHPGLASAVRAMPENFADEDPDEGYIPVVFVPGTRPWDPPTMPDPGSPAPPPLGGPPWPKDTLIAQVVPITPPCGLVGIGVVCSVTIWGARPPAAPPKTIAPDERGRQYFAPQVLCDMHIICNEGQRPLAKDGGKTLAELLDVCQKQANVGLLMCKVKYSIMDKNSAIELLDACLKTVSAVHDACITSAQEVTGNGEHPAP
jgi:hypothetical protein